MTKRFAIVLTIFFIFVQPLIAHADVIMGNDFYEKNKGKLEPLNRSFYVNGRNGRADARDEPGAASGMYGFVNGRIIEIAYVYNHKGTYWGIPPMGHAYARTGWFRMDELLLCYNSTDFEAEHDDELYNYNGDFEVLRTSEEFYVWQWPGSDREKIMYPVNEDTSLDDDNSIRGRYAYMDDDGREWVYVNIWHGSYGSSYRGTVNGWVCMSDPGNNSLPAFNPAPEPRAWVPGKTIDWRSEASPQGGSVSATNNARNNTAASANNSGNPESGFPILPVIIFSAFVVVSISAVAILLFRKR